MLRARVLIFSITTITIGTACGPRAELDAGLDASPSLDAGADASTPPDAAHDAGVDSGSDSSVATDAGTLGGELGAPCTTSADCRSGICFPTGFGMGRCSELCESTADCPAGWGCEDFGGADTCTCAAAGERCNGIDDDCDGAVDEGSAESIGCAFGEVCAGGGCDCPSERRCGGTGCTDIENDPFNCGACGNACSSGERCTSGSCCAPSPETCNGADDDCDGRVDEGGAGCAGAETCVSGSCRCPAGSMCGGSCVDLRRDSAHCGACGNACGGGDVRGRNVLRARRNARRCVVHGRQQQLDGRGAGLARRAAPAHRHGARDG
ncbi:MAG: MopE-related protein [Sandaracinaceae bacterium]|nr:MopE-related protein [Sandaracinaceae bacterium]